MLLPWIIAIIAHVQEVPAAATSLAVSVQDAPLSGPEDILADVEAGNLDEALAEVERRLARPQTPEMARELETLRGSILMFQARVDEARRAFSRAEAVDPTDPQTALYQLRLAFELRGVDAILPALDHLLDRFPGEVRTLDPLQVTPLIGWLRRNERGAEADNLLIRLAQNGFGGNDLTARDNYAMEGARAALEANRLQDARPIAARINSRRELVVMLTERKFAALWPELEARVGAHMEAAEAAFVRDAEAIFAGHSDDPAARRSLMEAYVLAGRLADADRAGAALAPSPQAMRQISEMAAWTINDHAYVLQRMGRGEEADRRFAALRAIDIEQSPWLISMVINRVQLLVQNRRFEQALPLADEAADLAQRHGSDYARQLVRRIRLCALHGLGRERERDAALAEFRAHETEAPSATIEGLFCLGSASEAEAVLVRWLQNPERAGGAIDALQPGAATRASSSSAVDNGWQELARRPAVRRALEPVGRILPDAFLPRPSVGQAAG